MAPGRSSEATPRGRTASVLAVCLSLYALYWVVFIVQPQVYRPSFLLVALVLTFLLFPIGVRPVEKPVEESTGGFRLQAEVARRTRPPAEAGSHALRRRYGPALDALIIAAAVVSLAWPIVDFDAFVYRAADPLPIDVALGALTILLVLEAARRTVGWILPVTAGAFLLYAFVGRSFDRLGLPVFAHRGYDVDRLVGTVYMTLEGIFGVPLDVTATYIILFTIYGAVLEHSGAGLFFIRWAMAATGRSRAGSAAGRTVALAGFLLGTVSGSGVATTVTVGSVSWPMLRASGYRPEVAGAILSAAGIGALLSPPTLGAAAFLIAEYLQISYLEVLVMATIPTILYYLSILVTIEADSQRLGTHAQPTAAESLWSLTRSQGYHFTSLAAIAAFMVAGMSAFRAVFWSTLLAVGLSYLRSETMLTPGRLFAALRSGATGVLGVCATTATAGIIVGVVSLTGLGLKIAGIIVALAGGHLLLTVVYSAIAVWLLGLAVPVTASYIIAAVMVAPALVQSGVPAAAAHMFIFYYAVLSEVSPPTALSPFAAAALTGGNPFETMMLTWKYTLPAFLVPVVFTATPGGIGLLMQGSPRAIAVSAGTAALGVAALAAGLGGWIRRRASTTERAALIGGGLLLCHTALWSDLAGLAATLVVLFLQSSWYSPATRAR